MKISQGHYYSPLSPKDQEGTPKEQNLPYYHQSMRETALPDAHSRRIEQPRGTLINVGVF